MNGQKRSSRQTGRHTDIQTCEVAPELPWPRKGGGRAWCVASSLVALALLAVAPNNGTTPNFIHQANCSSVLVRPSGSGHSVRNPQASVNGRDERMSAMSHEPRVTTHDARRARARRAQQPRNQPTPRRTKFGDGTFLGNGWQWARGKEIARRKEITDALKREQTHLYFRAQSSSQTNYGWTGHKPGSGLSDQTPATLGVFASLDRF
jgi:hypothetical protein